MALAEEQMIASEKYVTSSWRYERIGGRAGRWVMLNAPGEFSALLLDYLK